MENANASSDKKYVNAFKSHVTYYIFWFILIYRLINIGISLTKDCW